MDSHPKLLRGHAQEDNLPANHRREEAAAPFAAALIAP